MVDIKKAPDSRMLHIPLLVIFIHVIEFAIVLPVLLFIIRDP